MLGQMVDRDIRSRFTGTALGLIWLYAQPLLTILSYYVVFDLVLKARLADGAPTRALGIYLIVGMVPWMAFADSLSRTMYSLVDAGALMQKNAVAPVLFPLRAVIASSITFSPPLLLVVLVFVFMQGANLALLWLPVLLAAQILISFILGYALAILAAAMRDVMQIIGFCLSLGLFASPVLFTMSMIPETYRWILWLNPMTPVILAFQSILLLQEVPSWQAWMAMFAWLLTGLLLLDTLIKRSRDSLVDWL